MLRLTIFLVWLATSIALVAGDCTVKESFIDCIKPVLKLDSCVDKHDVKCACRYTYIEADCYDAFCPEETNPDEKARRECDKQGARDIFSTAINQSKSDKSSNESSSGSGIISSWTDKPSSAVPLARLPMAAMAVASLISTFGLVWRL